MSVSSSLHNACAVQHTETTHYPPFTFCLGCGCSWHVPAQAPTGVPYAASQWPHPDLSPALAGGDAGEGAPGVSCSNVSVDDAEAALKFLFPMRSSRHMAQLMQAVQAAAAAATAGIAVDQLQQQMQRHMLPNVSSQDSRLPRQKQQEELENPQNAPEGSASTSQTTAAPASEPATFATTPTPAGSSRYDTGGPVHELMQLLLQQHLEEIEDHTSQVLLKARELIWTNHHGGDGSQAATASNTSWAEIQALITGSSGPTNTNIPTTAHSIKRQASKGVDAYSTSLLNAAAAARGVTEEQQTHQGVHMPCWLLLPTITQMLPTDDLLHGLAQSCLMKASMSYDISGALQWCKLKLGAKHQGSASTQMVPDLA